MPDLFDIPDPHRHWGCRVNDEVTMHGLRALLIQNELIQVVILIDKGGEVVQFLHKPSDTDFLWRAPNALHNPARFTTNGSPAPAPFFDHWSGGWIEVVPNGGTACENKGAPLGFYGDTINIPWQYRILEDTPQRVRVAMWVKTYRTPFLLQRIVTIESGKAALFFEESLTNTGSETMDYMWGHHPVVGMPFLDESCRISAPPARVEVLHDEDGPDYRFGLHQVGKWPFIKDRNGAPLDLRIVPPVTGRTMDNCYLSEFEKGWIAISNANKKVGFGLAWDADVFRYIWVWEALGGGIGYPWYGRTYNIGIEPWTGFPCAGLNEAVTRKTAMQLKAGESTHAWLTAAAYTGLDEVNLIERDGTVK
jgi:hypothetical protein